MSTSTNNRADWKRILHKGIAPNLSTEALLALRQGLENEDPSLVQGMTCHPRATQEPVCAACPIGYAGWQGEALKTVAEVEQYFSQVCAAADERLGEPAASTDFLNWVDDTPPARMRRQLLEEVNWILARRLPASPPAAA
jgi:hypothetical protein